MTAAGDVGPEKQLPWEQRFSDRCNPILVREVQQALKGKLFLICMGLASAAIVIGALVATVDGQGQGQGRDVFTLGLTLLIPIVLFVLPLQAFLSMRQEMQGGISEQLLLSRLKPGAIVRGKILASMVQFVLFMAVFAPLLALSFLLRGVDVPTIAVCIAFSFLFNLVATTYCIAAGAFCRYKAVQPLVFVVAVAGPGLLSMILMGLSWEIVRDLSRFMTDPDYLMGTTALAGGAVLTSVLFTMVGASLLAHDFENRSSPFRVFAAFATLVSFVWVWVFVEPRFLDEVPPGMAAVLISASLFLWVYAVTEESTLSPRVRSLIPARPVLALLAVPFLPGGARGLVFTLCLFFVCIALGLLLPLWSTSGWVDRDPMAVALGLACYSAFYAGVGRLIRGRLGAGAKRSYAARLSVLILLLLGVLLPVVVEVLFTGRLRDWSPLHIMNPAWTIFEIADHRRFELFFPIGALAVLVVAANLPAMRHGVREVMDASAERRRRAA